jgi:ABC-type branched-subunit amino acid transport system substrate-binding protein
LHPDFRRKDRRALVIGCVAAIVASFSAGLAVAADLAVMHVQPKSQLAGHIARDYARGAALYFKHINDQGGINGSKIGIATHDDATGSGRLLGAALEAKPIAFIGAYDAQSVEGLLPILARLDAPLVGPVLSVAGVSATRHPHVFHLRLTVQQEAQTLAHQLHALGMRKIAVCYESGGFGESGLAGAKAQLALDGLKPVALAEHQPGQSDAAAGIIAAAQAQAVIFIGETDAAAAFIKSLRNKGSYAMVVASSNIESQRLLSMLPRQAAIWLAVAQPIPNPNSRAASSLLMREFLELQRRQVGEAVAPTRSTFEGFAAAKIVVEAIRRAGESPSSADVLRALTRFHDVDLGGVTASFVGEARAITNFARLGMVGPAQLK